MASKELSLEENVRRYQALYTGAVADTLDAKGFRDQVLPYYLTPVTTDMMVAGPAFTGQGYKVGDTRNDDSSMRIRMLDSIKAGTVSVWACDGHTESAHWGEIMSNAARERGCTGAVVDGGLRDTRFVLDMRFPVFCRFRCSASSIGRWEIKEWMVPITIGHTQITPGDFVFGDVDGVVIVPQAVTLEVLLDTEKIVARENGMRAELAKGTTVSDVYRKYGKF